ncbi:aspartate aminotransferase family protein [Agrococcus sp. HG114]|uniref:aspartate aminotransferase family protein n=1 Tax=Agrococcus sp. HG114 TaxID=2969757 RepID=UPI00215A82F7|nr:aspartate aminotransferase family protein [Agrococcus sp. HG114]MCR8670812.1 aspartate aminotransferase family protein [Agrococcus sp. HG114]
MPEHEFDPADGERARSLDPLILHSWSKHGTTNPFTVARGEGVRLWDYDGREYLDFSSQLVNTNIGHAHPKVVEAIQRQAAQLATVAPATTNLVRGEAAERILSKIDAMAAVFFTNGGADAVENAIRMARVHTGRAKVVSHYRSYHGNTGAAVNATGDQRRLGNEFATGHVHVFGPFLYRSEFWAETEEQESERALQHMRRVIEAEGPSTVAAILVEALPGTAGILVPPPGYLQGLRELADQHGIVLILDEVMAGFGRTGHWFAHQHDGVRPDLVTFAKGVNSGYVPVGGVIISDEILGTFTQRAIPGGLTYAGHPLAAASIVATIDAMTEEGIVEHAAHLGADILGPGLAELASRHEVIGEARGRGCFWALDLVADRGTREPVDASVVAGLKSALLERGYVPFTADNRIHVVPPLVMGDDDARRGLEILDDAFATLS